MDIGALVVDVDGVLTDGSLLFGPDGGVWLRFHTHDGVGLALWRQAGGQLAVVTGRDNAAMRARLAELGIDPARILSAVADKLAGLTSACEILRVSLNQTAYIGDDLPDWPAMQACGYPIAVANAVPQVRQIARYVTQRPGGRGAVGEAVEHLLTQQGRWEACLRDYLAGRGSGAMEGSR
jgi:3-deoxy-D-manno-octulosonate 8-phosphate phosphatase (KDO 8-P phosphatase)